MLIQVHDELVFNVIKDELEEVKTIVKDIMKRVPRGFILRHFFYEQLARKPLTMRQVGCETRLTQ